LAMSAAKAVVAEFRAFGVGRERDKFCARTAFDIVDRCERAEVGILGIEGFYLTESMTIPKLDCILDLSFGTAAYDTARNFLREGEGLPLFYEFTLDDDAIGGGEPAARSA
jgi:hypothetical protein